MRLQEPEPQYDIAQNYKMHPENVDAFMSDTDTPQPRATVPLGTTRQLTDDEVGLDDTVSTKNPRLPRTCLA